MFLGFAQFGKQSRKVKNKSKKQARKSNEIEHEKSLKKHEKNIPLTMKKTSKKRHVFWWPQKSCFFFRFWGGTWANLIPKIRFWADFVIFWGSPKSSFSLLKSAKGAVAFLEQFRLIGTRASQKAPGVENHQKSDFSRLFSELRKT